MTRLRPLRAPLPPSPSTAEVCADFEPARLEQARHLAGMSRGDLGHRIGVTPLQVVHWECGVNVPKPYELEKIAETTGHLVAFFKRGRPMLRITEADCHFRPCAYGR
jgi:transcriptional regulator with XRE-family HTH domain